MSSSVNHPDHYQFGDKAYEVIKIIQVYKFNFNLGNCFKYIARAGRKDPEKTIEDLQKAIKYLEFEVEFISDEINKQQNSVVSDQNSNKK